VEQLQTTFEQVIKQLLPSVVEIRTSQGLGSGVVFDDRGDVVTNAHVVGSSTDFQVSFSGRAQPVAARLVGAYPPDDLAVIRMASAQGTRPAAFAGSGEVSVGDLVLAIGNPLGLASSVTDGIVSAVGRTITEPAGGGSSGATIPNAIQTSASINPGNSGGALVDLHARVIGIPTLAALSPETGGQAPGIGFAISADTVSRIAPQLIATGKVSDSGRAALGVRVTTVTDAAGDPAGAGVVQVVAGGPADRAGIQVGDVITDVAGQAIATSEDLAAALAGQKVGARVPVRLQRDSGQQTVTVTLGSL
jgi:putative serine protease PepD